MSTTVVYASGESGWISSENGTYLTAARGAGTTTAGATAATGYVGQLPGFAVYQTFLTWDTSAVGTDTVSIVDFEVDGTTNASVFDFVLETYAYDWGATLTSADYRDSDSGIPALGSIIASYDTAGGWAITAGYNQTMGALTAFAAAINGAGDTRVVVISDQHRLESQPTNNEYVSFECTGATNDARLTITHAASGPTLTYAKPTDDIATTGWATAPLWSKVDDDPGSPDATVITATAS